VGAGGNFDGPEVNSALGTMFATRLLFRDDYATAPGEVDDASDAKIY
jgi:hypothetical protein